MYKSSCIVYFSKDRAMTGVGCSEPLCGLCSMGLESYVIICGDRTKKVSSEVVQNQGTEMRMSVFRSQG